MMKGVCKFLTALLALCIIVCSENVSYAEDYIEEFIIESEEQEFYDEAELINAANSEHNETISYYVHQQNIGDTTPVTAGVVAGSTGSGNRLEAFYLKRSSASTSDVTGGIRYSAHCQDIGWTDWSYDGAIAGTTGKSKRMEALKIELTGEMKNKYDIYYKTYMSNCGWLDWTKNGEISGTSGYGAVIEGVQVLLVLKDSENAPVCGRYAYLCPENTNNIFYSGHVQDYGDVPAVTNGAILGTTGKSKRLEGMTVKLSHSSNQVYGTLKYKVHIQDYGWVEEVGENKFAGTTGESRRLEAFSLTLSGDIAKYYDVYYRTHVQNFGWLDWAKNGDYAGSAGYSYRMEALQIKILPKGSAAPGATANAYYDKNDTSYQTQGYQMLVPYLDQILSSCTNGSMTDEEKLKALYYYVKSHIKYETLSNDCPSNFVWHEYYAYQTAVSGKGNCYGWNYLLGHLALRAGITDVKFYKGSVCAERLPHGWVEINGLIYDPELDWKNGKSFYGVKNYEVFSYHPD